MKQKDAYLILTGFPDFIDASQREVAEAVGLNPVTLSRWQASDKQVARTTSKLVRLLQVRPEQFYVLRDL